MLAIRRTSIALLFVYGAPAAAETPKESAQVFLEHAQLVNDEFAKASPDLEIIRTEIGTMLESARTVLVGYSELHPQCAEQLQALVALYPQLDVWTPDEIRQNIELGNSLPPGRGCYPARDVVAHPAIVRAGIRDGLVEESKARLLHELEEAVEHMQEIAVEFGR